MPTGLENYKFFGAPHVAIIHTDERSALPCDRLRRLCRNFMLAAQALGLGTIRRRPGAASGLIRRHFKLADDAPRGLRHFVRLADNSRQGQQLSHLAGERADNGYVHRGMNHNGKSPIATGDRGFSLSEFRRDK